MKSPSSDQPEPSSQRSTSDDAGLLSVPYAPIVWRDNLWWQYARQAAKMGLIMADGRIDAMLPDMMEKDIIIPYMRNGAKIAREEGVDPSAGMNMLAAVAMNLQHWIPMLGQYEIQGRQIFQLSEGLLEMLQNTDQGDCTLSNLNLPYQALYIHLGMQQGISSPYHATEDEVLTHEFVTGAFVATQDYDVPGEMRGKRLKFGLTTATALGRVNEAPIHYFDVLPKEAELPVLEAIEVAMKRRINALKKAWKIDESKGNSWFDGFVGDTAILIKKAVPLIMNTLFSMEAMREDANLAAKLSMGNGTPKALADKWSTAAGSSKRQKLESTFYKEGHTVVKILGAAIPSSRDILGDSGKDGPRRVTWRVGHFRQQAHGPRMSLRKRILIQPVLVNAHGANPIDVDGHIYKIGGDTRRSKPR